MSSKDDRELYRVYAEIAMERDHECTGCGSKRRLTHSHLVAKSADRALKCVKENITYHCVSMGDVIGCHNKWESVQFWTLKDAYKNMQYVYSVRPDMFWLKVNHAIDSYSKLLKKAEDAGTDRPFKDAVIKNASIAIIELNKIKSIANH